jgi:hypothetical protein
MMERHAAQRPLMLDLLVECFNAKPEVRCAATHVRNGFMFWFGILLRV